MGESVAEATLTRWLKEVSIEIDDILVEIATDKVDSDVPSEVKGVLTEKKFTENDVVQVGEVIAIIQTDIDDPDLQSSPEVESPKKKKKKGYHRNTLISLPDPLPNLRVCPKW